MQDSSLKSKSNTPKSGNARAEVAAVTFNVGLVCICGVILFLIIRLHTAFSSWQWPSYRNHGSNIS